MKSMSCVHDPSIVYLISPIDCYMFMYFRWLIRTFESIYLDQYFCPKTHRYVEPVHGPGMSIELNDQFKFLRQVVDMF